MNRKSDYVNVPALRKSRWAGKSRGITLVELIIAMIIGGIFFYIVGTLMVTTQSSALKASTKVTFEDDFRFARDRMEYVIRGSTGPVHGSGSASDPLELRRLSDNLREDFWLDVVNKKLKLTWNFATPTSEIIMNNVTAFTALMDAQSEITFTITQDKSGTTGFLPGQNLVVTRNFTVKCRNVD